MPARLVVKLTWGVEAPERVSQALTVAATAAAADVEVSLWLTGDATYLATAGVLERVNLPHAGDLAELRDLIATEGRVTVCSQCAARRDLTSADLLDGVRVAGTGAYLEEILPAEATALVY
ncbi:MAG: DsrE family protein [Actinobacteria bacterium]|nr:DsrE family protein [Actinomycetota bacterium]